MENNQPQGNGAGGMPSGNMNMNGGMPPQGGYGPQGGPQQGYGPQGYGQQPYPPQGGYPQQQAPKPPKEPMDPKKKKMIIILCSVGGGLLLLGIAALIILPIILAVDYEATYDVADRVNDVRYDAQKSDSCGGVMTYVTSTYTTKSSYEKYVASCKEDLANFKSGVEELAGTSGVKRDDTIKGSWEKFKESYDGAVSAYETLVDVYADWHNYEINNYEGTNGTNWWKSMSEDKVKTMFKPLTESSNEQLKKYGSARMPLVWKWVSTYQNYEKAYDAYYDASYNAANKSELRDAMNSAKAQYDGALADLNEQQKTKPDIKDTEGLVGVDLDKGDNQFFTKFGNVYSEISSKYWEYKVTDTLGL